MKKNIVNANVIVPKKSFPVGKLWALTGNLRGQSFTVSSQGRLTIGRDSSCSIVINDPKASRVHAEVIYFNSNTVVTDLKSQNGILVNEKKVLQDIIYDQDKVIIGHSVFKFEAIKEDSKNNFKDVDVSKSKFKASPRRLLGLAGLLILLILVWGYEDDSAQPKKIIKSVKTQEEVKSEADNRTLLRRLAQQNLVEDKKLNKEVHSYVRDGLRELREDNFFRSISEFDKALDVNPNDSQALYYRRKALESLDSTIQNYRIHARREIASIKYKSALVSYCAIIRLLDSYPEDKRYKSAKKDIDELKKKLDYSDGEVQCFKR